MAGAPRQTWYCSVSLASKRTRGDLSRGASAVAGGPPLRSGSSPAAISTTESWSSEPAAATTTLAGTYRAAWKRSMTSSGVVAMTSLRPMIARPSGWEPNTASPRTSNTLSWGSSSYIAISWRITLRSVSTSSNAGRQTMSPITSNARGRCRSSIRECTDVVSLPVPALSSAPIESKI